jgi:uncharacterized membrane protein YcgQ (UPF0703/DUF1980 family)
MRRRRLPLIALAVALSGCGVTISAINARPDRYYEHKVTFEGQVERMQFLAHETLLELSDARGARIIVRSTEPVDVKTGDWVKVKGVLVPEALVENVPLYDVITAERVQKTRAPRLANLM